MDDLQVELDDLRLKIDAADRDIVTLLNNRVQFALKISEVKDKLGLPIYDELREKKVLALIENANSGIIPNESIKRIFSLIIKETRELEEKMRDDSKK
jgi:chorismate mutase